MQENDWGVISVPSRRPEELVVGMIALDIDDEIESDVRNHLAGAPVKISTNRIPTARGPSAAPYSGIEDDIDVCMRGLLPTSRIDAVVFGCTSAAAMLGSDKLAEIVHRTRPSVPIVDPASASINALRRRGTKSIGLITPYSQELSDKVAELFEEAGLNVLAKVRFVMPDGDTQPTLNHYRQACSHVAAHMQVDGIFVSCTGLATAGIAAQLAAEYTMPILSSNQVIAEELTAILTSRSQQPS